MSCVQSEVLALNVFFDSVFDTTIQSGRLSVNYNPSAQIKKQTSRCLRQLSGSLTETNIKKKKHKQGKSDKDADKRDQPQAP